MTAFKCCREWDHQPATVREDWAWVALHRFSHSRTTFTADTLAETANIPVERARGLIAEARMMRWIWPPADGIWVGRLPRGR